MSSHTDSASANVVLTSAVGTGRQLGWCRTCSENHAIQSTGMKSIAFISSTHTNTVSATGATKRWRSPCVKMPFTWSSMNSMASSMKACRFPGTPEVAPRTAHQRNPNATTPSTSDVANVSTCSVQKPPSLNCLALNARWCLMYSVGVSCSAAAI